MRIRRKHFSLIELMVVIAIIGAIAAIGVKNFIAQGDMAKVDTTRATINQVEEALAMYKIRKHKFPSTDEGLEALVSEKILKGIPTDGWQNPLNYSFPGSRDQPFDIWSLGADGIDGGQEINADIFNGSAE
jgi:general secretion pathway protein G